MNATTPAANALIRDTRYGQVEGAAESAGTWSWKGIPYARPPVGALRWRAPVAPQPWSGVRAALAFGPACIQNPRLYGPGANNRFDASVGAHIASGIPSGSEDCLTLNIWRPASVAAGLPVLVFIHGGSNVSGFSADPLYDGAALAKAANAVVVTANYRLGQLGFFRHPALRDPAADATLGADDASGNFAVLDILQALRFVRDDIGRFGGDSGNVTLMGQSAGCINILAVLCSAGGRSAGLFHKLVALSGGISVAGSPGFPQPVNDLAGNHGFLPALASVETYEHLSQALLLKLLIEDGSAPDAAAALAWCQNHSSAEIAAYLRAKPAAKIVHVGAQTIAGIGDTTACGPIPEGVVVASDPIAAILAGQVPQVPVLSGMTRHECKLLSSWLPLIGCKPGIKLPEAELFATLTDAGKVAAARFGDIIDGAYPDRAAYDAAIEEIDARFFGALRTNLLDALATRTPERLWAYRFDWEQEPAPWNDIYGAAHLLDLPFLLGNFGPSLYADVVCSAANERGRLALSGAMMAALAAFARNGDPNDAQLGVHWPNWPRQLIFDATPTARKLSVAAA